MKRIAILLVGFLPLLASAQAPSYSKQIQPFFTKYCVECHPADAPDGGLSMDSYKNLMMGGDHGKALVPGKPDQSRLVRMIEGKTGPRMPPKKSKQPTKDEIPLIRAWVAAGAKDDSAERPAALPPVAPRHKNAPAVTALAYHPAGTELAAAQRRELLLLDAAGDVRQRLSFESRISALAYDRDGRLAVAVGEAGAAGRLHLLGADRKPGPALEGHIDVVHGLAFSPDGKLLASCGYDRLIRLWDASTGKPVRDLKDHSDSVYGLAFSPDGTLLASAAADRAVKVWDVASGRRLYTLSESNDWLYAVVWFADGKRLAAAGVDRSIRVWEVTRDGGTILHSVFGHEGTIARLACSADGKTLWSLGDDRRAKCWEADRMVERTVIDVGNDIPLSLALQPQGKTVAVGRFDGALVVLDEKTGKPVAQPLPVKPKPPVLEKLAPMKGVRGKPVDLTLTAKGDRPMKLIANHPGVEVQTLPPAADQLAFRITFPATTPPGVYRLTLKNEAGESKPVDFQVDLADEVKETEPNDSPRTGQLIALPATVVGGIDRAGAVDFFRFEAKEGQAVGVRLQTTSGTLESVLVLIGPDGATLAESTSGTIGLVCRKAGTHALGVRDRDYRGGSTYRLHVGDVPVVSAVFPLGVQRGTEAEVKVEGVHLGVETVRIKIPAVAVVGSRVPLPGVEASVVVGEFADALDRAKPLPVEATANGRLMKPGETHAWRFSAKKGGRLLLDVESRRIGSPLDSTIEILDAKGDPLPRAVLRAQARTWSTFRDHDSFGAGIRLETWGELAVNDYIYLNSELLRIRALPKNPDDDCQFFSEGGRRRGFLGTTPGQLSLGTPMYKVTLHPPGTTFPPNGLPLTTLSWRNDDGGSVWGKDSFLDFDPPADGEYVVRIGDACGHGGPDHGYRLTLRRPRPDFSLSFAPTSPAVWQGGAVPVTMTATRKDGYDGDIVVKLDGLPAGFHAPTTSIPAGETSAVIALSADRDAKADGKPIKAVGRARIDGMDVVRESVGAAPTVAAAGDLTTTTDQSEVTVRPGGQTKLTVRIERRGFEGRVPLDVRGLPHGVRVLDIGLNGILITPTETVRTIVIQCDPWVMPTELPFVVLSRRESKNTEHAAKSVLLKIAK